MKKEKAADKGDIIKTVGDKEVKKEIQEVGAISGSKEVEERPLISLETAI